MHRYDLESYSRERFGVPFHETKLGALVKRLPFKLGFDGVQEGPWIAGGAVRKFAMGANINDGGDVDVMFKNATQFENAKLDLNGLPSGIIFAKERTVDFVFEGLPPISLVRGSFFTGPRHILEDMTLTCTQFTIDRTMMYVGSYAMLDGGRRVLRVNKPEKLSFSAKHIRRYLEKGYRIDDDRIMPAVVSAGDNPRDGY